MLTTTRINSMKSSYEFLIISIVILTKIASGVCEEDVPVNTVNFVNNASETTNLNEEYLFSKQNECLNNSRNFISCAKYRIAKVLWFLSMNKYNYFTKEKEDLLYEENTISRKSPFTGIRFLQLREPSNLEIFSEKKSIEGDSIWKFMKRSFEYFLQNHGFVIPFNSDSMGIRVRALDTGVKNLENRGEKKKKKWLIILPLIILLKIAHLKMTLVTLIFGVVGLQLALLAGGLYIIYYLKKNTLCKIHPHFIHSHSHVWDSDPEYSSFVGSYSPHSHSGPGSPGENYLKDWASSKAYSGYNYLDTISQPV